MLIPDQLITDDVHVNGKVETCKNCLKLMVRNSPGKRQVGMVDTEGGRHRIQ